MSNTQTINIFSKGENLKFAPFWEFAENHIQKLQGNLNMKNLIKEAMHEETVKLIMSLELLIGMEQAKYLANYILDQAVELVMEKPDLEEEELRSLLYERKDFLTEAMMDEFGMAGLKLCVSLITNLLDAFLRMKSGADVFCDFVFSSDIITERLENPHNISRLFYFLSAVGFTYEKVEQVLSEEGFMEE